MSKYQYQTTEIDYQIAGEGKPILFIHGWGMDKHLMNGCFEPIFKKMDGYKRIYIDLPGMGVSKAGEVTTSDEILVILKAFAEEVIKEKFFIVGESYGGYLARGFINRYTELVSGFILLCPLVYPGFRKGTVVPLQVMEKDEDFLKTLTEDEYNAFTYLNVILTKPVYERFLRDAIPGIELQNKHFLDEVLDGGFSYPVDEIEQPIDINGLIITGKQDTEVGYKDQFQLLKNYPNASYCVMNRAGHNLQIEQPEMFEGMILDWMQNTKIEW